MELSISTDVWVEEAERRRSRRRVFPMVVQTTDSEGRLRKGVLTNLSETGAFVLDDDPPEAGERLAVSISLFGSKEVLRQVEVVWSQGRKSCARPCYGARFCDPGVVPDLDDFSTMLKHAERREAMGRRLGGFDDHESVIAELRNMRRFRHDPLVQEFIDRYSSIGKRDPFLWSWVGRGLELTTLSCVDPTLQDELLAIKILSVMLDVVLDDVADAHQDPVLLAELLRIPYERRLTDEKALSSHNHQIWRFTSDLWDEIEGAIQRLPRYERFAPTLEFDYRQLLNCMRYSLLINRSPMHVNLAEHDLYQPHNMHMMVSATIDLMASPSFDEGDLGWVREVVTMAQRMGRLGNMITTWQRELCNRDMTSGVFPLALHCGVVSPRELGSLAIEELERRLLGANIEQRVLEEWRELHRRVLATAKRVRSVDVEGLAAGLEQLLRIHLGSGWLK